MALSSKYLNVKLAFKGDEMPEGMAAFQGGYNPGTMPEGMAAFQGGYNPGTMPEGMAAFQGGNGPGTMPEGVDAFQGGSGPMGPPQAPDQMGPPQDPNRWNPPQDPNRWNPPQDPNRWGPPKPGGGTMDWIIQNRVPLAAGVIADGIASAAGATLYSRRKKNKKREIKESAAKLLMELGSRAARLNDRRYR